MNPTNLLRRTQGTPKPPENRGRFSREESTLDDRSDRFVSGLRRVAGRQGLNIHSPDRLQEPADHDRDGNSMICSTGAADRTSISN